MAICRGLSLFFKELFVCPTARRWEPGLSPNGEDASPQQPKAAKGGQGAPGSLVNSRPQLLIKHLEVIIWHHMLYYVIMVSLMTSTSQLSQACSNLASLRSTRGWCADGGPACMKGRDLQVRLVPGGGAGEPLALKSHLDYGMM